MLTAVLTTVLTVVLTTVLTTVLTPVSAWEPQPRLPCVIENVKGGSLTMPHEKYCQLYLSCDLYGNSYENFCGPGLLFEYGDASATCAQAERKDYAICPNWPCDSEPHYGRRYPDTCCSKYWECTAYKNFAPRLCGPGLQFNHSTESCEAAGGCVSHRFCPEVVTPVEECQNFESPTGDPCVYRTRGWEDIDRHCPMGVAYKQADCSCTEETLACSGNNLNPEEIFENKKLDTACRSSGRIDFTNGALITFSDKMNKPVDHYIYKSPGFSLDNMMGVFDNSQGDPFIYDFFYHNNPLHSPLGITVTVKFDDVATTPVGTEYVLVENRWSTDPANSHCSPPSLRMTATYLGVTDGQFRWQFDLTARGSNGVQSRGTGAILGLDTDFFKLLFTFGPSAGSKGMTMSGYAVNRGPIDAFSRGVTFIATDNRDLGSTLMPSKCGFAIGRNLKGKMRHFSVHEGCGEFIILG